ncbi:hypothetical protein I2494_12490 [Budviciaceae bacterium BWR-B9]|uniref:Uncharacterized protein n=1 Tax=Limnobaculum allomyrinae TaxID=2791986 RepID=A0ABS1IRZ0_9GAMM|nr:hypothetical protein [Limnobaculum allomyrinae]MBV7692246.1 hypothetical protein [Limnobaculum sp. M2-1]
MTAPTFVLIGLLILSLTIWQIVT